MDGEGLRIVSGIELRYALTATVFEAEGPLTVAELVDALEFAGLGVRGRPSKTVSDALRWEGRRGRIIRRGRGLYGRGHMPRQTAARIRDRVHRLRRPPEPTPTPPTEPAPGLRPPLEPTRET
ncbi:hypothetical protein [Nocardia cyriacigeorgica]|uniref:hypothetical protein n=2 Tax=Nocardia cyriacigeorgica TaxID=135487 RepID=UPI001E659E25|nr:hypothetical protein [Nocardia cyriacigeorgica]